MTGDCMLMSLVTRTSAFQSAIYTTKRGSRLVVESL